MNDCPYCDEPEFEYPVAPPEMGTPERLAWDYYQQIVLETIMQPAPFWMIQ